MTRIVKQSLLLLLFCATANRAFAGTDPQIVTKLEGVSQLAVNNYTETVDVIYYDPGHINDIENPANDIYRNTIALLINEDHTKFIPADFRATIRVSITWTDKNGNLQGPVEKDLEVDYKIAEGTKYDARNYFYFDNARKVKVTIVSIDQHSATWDLREVLILENRMEVKRDYIFNNAGTAINVQAAPGEMTTENKIDELVVSWDAQAFKGITHYDIEWTWVDIDALDRYKSGSPANFDATLLFKNNSSRVTVTADNSSYKVPLIYDGTGYLFYRVRPLQYRENSDIMEGEWSAKAYTGITYYSYSNGHEPDLNWQVSTSFAEEGKRKTVISYFDGTLRSRQTVTKDNVNNNTVVAETLYDYQGRPAINILPAPTLNKVIEYAKNFNRFSSSSYPKDIYDLVPVGQTICSVNTPQLDNNYGSSKYYSPNNPKVNEGMNKYIPDAEGYPYAETRYTPDATGRIASQSGVGPDYQLGAGKHATNYYYGYADQKELNALFGTEVGDHSHYFKNMVRDANGQYSVSYSDMHGRTVATALAGSPPANLKPLESYPADPLPYITKNLLGSGNLVKDRSIESATTLLVTNTGLHTFHYELSPQSAEIIACNPPGQTVCYDCYYDLEIRVTGTCGDVPVIITRRNFTFGNYDILCSNAPPSLVVDTAWTLPEGEYNITKKLTLSKDAQDWYRENLYTQKNICKTLLQFYTEIYDVMMATANCNMTCASCSTALGTLVQYRAKFLQSQGISPTVTVSYENEIVASYNEAKANCDAMCEDPESKLSMIRETMLQDVTPHQGQYAKIDKDINGDGTIDPGLIIYEPDDVNHEYGEWEVNTNRKYNIFNTSPPYTGYRTEVPPYYRSPRDEKDNTRYYKDEFGRRDESINITGIDYPQPLVPLKDKSPDDFSDEFRDSWAASLIYYHPEYCKLKIAEQYLTESFKWDGKLENIDTWAAAVTAGYISQNGLLNADPFFSGAGAGKKPTMTTLVNSNFRSGISMWQVAMMSMKCLNSNDPACGNTIGAYPTNTTYGFDMCESDKNNAWRILRSVYLTMKDSLVNEYLDQQCPGINYNELAALKYQRRFGHYANFYSLEVANAIANSTDPEAAAEEYLLPTYTSTCDAYIYTWEQKLLNCDVLAARPDKETIVNAITSQMKQVCIWGSNVDHPYGSSTLAPGDPRTPNSFESIITSVFTTYGIPVTTALCHPYVIDYPQPYDKQLAISDETVLEPRDACVCARLTELQLEKQQAGYTGSLSNFIQYHHGIFIRQSLIDTLIAGCQSACSTYDPPISVPAILSCNTPVKNCIACDEYVALRTDFMNEFPGFAVPYNIPQTEEETNRNIAFERYMNSKTGFRKSWVEYLQFQEACQNYNQEWTCTKLDSLINLFNEAYPNAGYGQNCQQLFTSFFNQLFGTGYTYSGIEALYMQYCGNPLIVCQATLTCTGFAQVINDFYQQYGAAIVNNPNCQALFVNFFNARYNTGYSWAGLQSLYLTLCGKDLDVCDPFNCGRLQQAMSDWRSQQPIAWAESNCSMLWTIFFNNWFQSNLEDWQIAELYNNCSANYTPCQPPVECGTLDQLIKMYNNLGTAACDSLGLNPADPGYCNDCFTWFINSKLNTNYTFEQISLMYQVSCGSTLFVCGGQYDCQDLTDAAESFIANYQGSPAECQDAFVVFFNAHYNKSLSYLQIMAIYKLSCGTQPSLCGRIPITSCDQLNTVQNDFLKLYPNPGSYFGVNCQAAFAGYFNQVFGDTLSYPAIELYYVSLCGKAPNICDTANCQQLRDFLTTYHQQYDTLAMSQDLCRNLFTKLFNDYLQNPGGGDQGSVGGGSAGPAQTYTWPEVAAMYQHCGIALNICYGDNGPLMACDKIAAAKQVFYVLYPSAATDGSCNKIFTEFFNLYFNAAFEEYENLEQWVLEHCGGPALNVCGGGSTEGGEVPLDPPANIPNVPLPTAPMLCETTTLFPTLLEEPKDPCDYIKTMALNKATELYNIYIRRLKDDFDKKYTQKCLSAGSLEIFTVTSQVSEHHYTLYYYDQAGALVKTVPPAGANPNYTATFYNQVEAARISGATVVPAHTLATEYRYNTLGQVIAQKSPDGGLSKFWYDRLGRLVISQNAKQSSSPSGGGGGKYSYTKYDELGRITEVGQLSGATVTQTLTQNQTQLNTWFSNADASREQITITKYDVPKTELCVPAPAILCQTNLRNRVSYSYVQPTAAYLNNNLPYTSATYYTYDIHGNVDVLLQHYNDGIMQTVAGNAFKRMEYKYDLVSGKVNEVAYQPGVKDQFYHRYEYDAENKLTKTETSADYVYWQQQAVYSYYRHGPLARTETGQLGVQGTDYVYTLQGWLKGVNTTSPNPSTGGGGFDPGGDGVNGARIARDAYGFSLNHNTTDYKSINNTVLPFAVISNGLPQLGADGVNTGKNLYNGNIRAMLVNIPKLGDPKLYGYQYDQLNRITAMNAYNGLNTTTNVFTPAVLDDYKERVTYDGNGNILTYLRNGTATPGPVAMDNMIYHYKTDKNQLDYVHDGVAAGNYTTDIDAQTAGNYQYDEIGNLTKDVAEGIGTNGISWTVYGKIAEITKSSGTTISYTYDASGNRISKTVGSKTTWYVRDASGNVMAIYENENTEVNSGKLSQIEVDLYGSSRVGLWQRNLDVESTNWWLFDKTAMAGTNGGIAAVLTRGRTTYELSNHLGNVLVTVSDRKLQVPNGTTGLVGYYTADVVTATDYYPFGLDMPGRKFGAEGRYGFNGKERDKDMHSLTAYDYGFRIYNPAIGKFLSVDPLSKSYPWYTPYQFAGNKPINCIDLDGLEDVDYYYARWFPTIATKASELAKNNPSQLAAMKQEAWNKVLAKIDGIIPNYFDYTHNLNGVIWEGGLKDEVLTSVLDSREAGEFNSYYNPVNSGDYKDINPLLEEAASNLANDHYRASLNGREFYERYINSINSAKDPNAKAALIAERSEKSWGMILTFQQACFEAATAFLGGRYSSSFNSQRTFSSAKYFQFKDAAKGVSAEGAVWAQKTFGGKFSAGGKFAGQTVKGVAGALRNGKLSAADVPINVIVRNGQTFILNTRSSAALMQAGIPRSAWNVVNQTGVTQFENMLSNQLLKNSIPNGTNTIKSGSTILTH